MLFGFFLLAKPVTSIQLLGALLIIAGVTLTTTSKEATTKRNESLSLSN
jgi:drug/metabolite transporter (DMT)-like permease